MKQIIAFLYYFCFNFYGINSKSQNLRENINENKIREPK